MEQRANRSGRQKLSRVQLNGHPSPRSRGKLTKRDLAFAEEGLDEMNRLVTECNQMTARMDELEPRFKQACMQKAWIILASYLFGALILMFSLFWSGTGVILLRIALAAVLVGLYFLPVHWFARGALRSDARLVRRLDKRSLANAKRAARIGQSMNRKLRRRCDVDRQSPVQ